MKDTGDAVAGHGQALVWAARAIHEGNAALTGASGVNLSQTQPAWLNFTVYEYCPWLICNIH